MAACPQKGCLTLLVFLLSITEADGQDISCSISKKSNCNKGLVPSLDVFTVACILDLSVAMTSRSAEFFVSLGSSLRSECSVFLSLCQRVAHCNCYDNGGTYTVYFNKTAALEYSQTEIRLALGNSKSYGSVITDIMEEPGEAECTLNGKIIPNAYSGECPFSIAKDTGTKINYTCNSALSPVMTYISFNNTNYEGSSSVVIDPSESGIGQYIFSSTICGIAAHSGSCNAALDSEPKTTCDDTCLIIVCVIVGVVVLVIIVGGIIVTLCVCWKWKNKTRSPVKCATKPETPKPKPRKHVTCENQV